MIRTDTAKTTNISGVGRKGTMQYNVGWGGPDLVIKGDEHTIAHNTVLGELQVVMSFGEACGMNENSKVLYNAAFVIKPRGTCKCSEKPCIGGDTSKEFKELPQKTKGKYSDGNLCEKLRSCELFDFRPAAGDNSLKLDGGVAGAYASTGSIYFIPGRRLEEPSSPIPADGTQLTKSKTSLMFLQAKNCKKHMIYFGENKTKVETMKSKKKQLVNNANIWDITSNLVKPKYYWRVKPMDCPGAKVSPVWEFAGKPQQKKR